MCVMEAADLTGGVRQIRYNVNSVTGWGNPGTRGGQKTPAGSTYNTYNTYTNPNTAGGEAKDPDIQGREGGK